MSSHSTVSEWALPWAKERIESDGASALHLAIVWSLDEPHRVGEVAALDARRLLGRGEQKADDPHPRVEFRRDRPGKRELTGPLESARISRRQLTLAPQDDGRLEVERTGRCPLAVNGQRVDRAIVAPGDVLTLWNSMVLIVLERPTALGRGIGDDESSFEFGQCDAHGIVGESPAIWRMREHITFASKAAEHAIVVGPSGSGKELAARAIHALSSRSDRALVTRSAATFPEGLVDAELFGNVKNYPNAGMPERPGLIGEADGSSLFLDEIGELAPQLQAHLLRVLDRDGEYQRLGESKARRADVRLIAATNRSLDALKHDLLARFAIRIEVPSLSARREDVALLVRHVLERALEDQPDLETRFFEQRGGARAEPRIEPAFLEALLRHPLPLNIRDLERLIWVAISSSRGPFIGLTSEVARELDAPERDAGEDDGAPIEPDRAALESALLDNAGNVSAAARALGLKNRFVLYRLMKKHGIEAPKDP